MPILNRCWNRIAGLGMVAYLAVMNIASLRSSPWPTSVGRSMEHEVDDEVNSLVLHGVNSVFQKIQQRQRSWRSTVQSDSVQQEWFLSQQTTPPALKIILLWDGDSLELLQHNLRSLHAVNYFGNKIDVQVQMPARKGLDELRLEAFRNDLKWEHGDVHMMLIKEQQNDGDDTTKISLRNRILQVWQPASEEDHVIIFHVDNHSNQHPHAQWYQWLQQAHASVRTNTQAEIVGVALSTKKLYSKLSRERLLPNNNAAFLFPEVNFYSGFAPTASMWQEFADYMDCAETNLGVGETHPQSNHFWNDVEKLWGDFVSAKHGYHLYQFPNGEPLFSQEDLVGLSSRKLRAKSAYALSSPSLHKSNFLVKFNFQGDNNHTELVQESPSSAKSPRLRTLVMSAAVGYPIETFKNFVGTLRTFYQGDVILSVNATISDEIATYLKEQNVQTMVQPEVTGSDGEAKARDRFPWFASVCREDQYDLCLHTDFRDSMFQADPFTEFYGSNELFEDSNEQHLYIYQHEMIMNPWHFRKMAACGIFDAYGKHVAGKWILNSGSVIATPLVWKELAHYNGLWDSCNDQVVYNALIYTPHEDLLPEHRYSEHRNITMHFHRQGEGAMNIVGFAKGESGFVHRDSKGQFLNRQCLPSPVVHQFDRVE